MNDVYLEVYQHKSGNRWGPTHSVVLQKGNGGYRLSGPDLAGSEVRRVSRRLLSPRDKIEARRLLENT